MIHCREIIYINQAHNLPYVSRLKEAFAVKFEPGSQQH